MISFPQVPGEEFYDFVNMRGAYFLSFMLGYLLQMMCFEDRIDVCFLFDLNEMKGRVASLFLFLFQSFH